MLRRLCVSLFLGGLMVSSGLYAQQLDGCFGVVDVSRVFSSYKKVYKIQETVDNEFLARKLALEEQTRKWIEDGREIQNMRKQLSGRSELLFDRVQKFQKEQFLIEKKRDSIDQEIADRMRDSMREILTEIRAAIHKEAEKRNCLMIFRTPDRDDLYLKSSQPSKEGETQSEEQQVAELLRPKRSADLVARIIRNPVLYGSESVDITVSVIEALNADFARSQTGELKSATPALPLPKE